jgi:hypothetical protein
MANAGLIAARMAEGIGRAQAPVTVFGLFGSARYNPACRDVDVLFVCKAPAEAVDYDYEKEMNDIARLMAGEDGTGGVRDPFLENIAASLCRGFERDTGVPVDIAFGPSPNERFLTTTTVHLNGPVSERMWVAFGTRFPLHAMSICNSFQVVLGDVPTRPTGIEYTHVWEMASSLERRIARVGASERFAKKLLQAIGALSGAKSCLVQDLVEASFAREHPLRQALKGSSLTALSAGELCGTLLAELYSRAESMKTLALAAS